MRRYCLVLACGVAALGSATGDEPRTWSLVDAYLGQFERPELAKELCVRVQSDQAVRRAMNEFQVKHKLVGTAVPADPKLAADFETLTEACKAEDRRNAAWLKGVVAEHGWPGRSLVGPLSAQNAWLLAQHADADLPFQKSCLAAMEPMPTGEVDPQHLAYLADRVALADGQKQKYGTQAAFKDGKVVAAPIEDEAGVDARRKSIGLGPLADYLKVVEKMYAPPRKRRAAKPAGAGPN